MPRRATAARRRTIPAMRSTGSARFRRLFNILGGICTVANLVGAVFVFLYLVVIAPQRFGDRSWVVHAIAFSAYAVVAFPVEAWWSEYRWRRVLGWFDAGRPPTRAEQDATLRLPMHEAGWSFVAWAIASALFPVYALFVGANGDEALRVGLTIFDGGLVTCAIVFL